jgi:hypothetical protein
MNDRLLEIADREFVAGVKFLFDYARPILGTGMAERPVIGGVFLRNFPVPSCLLQRVCKALIARERFHQDAPGWPCLPLHEDVRKVLVNDDNPRLNVLAYYANSLDGEDWDYEGHPRFGIFASGIMACDYAPREIRNDLSLQQEFPARPLAGLCDGQLVWRSPERLAEDRDMLQRVAAYEADMRAATP